ncbi:MAG: helix-turn-helix domain-containing protein [Proteobacteria bacterium]|nr:helix-turn-helix domain-containing protein [Desulfobacula sp.]MBU4133493.1 helix-turn-helix domain-containing protein [Pseudomonadota bacterium]
MPNQNAQQEKISIEISFSGGLEAHLPSLTHLLEKLKGEFSTSPGSVPIDADEIWTPEELCDFFKIDKTKLYSLTMQTGPGSLPRFKLGKYLRFKKLEAIGWFNGLKA